MAALFNPSAFCYYQSMSRKEPNFKNLLYIALPMIVSQASETIMLFVDRLFLSWLGKSYIAAGMSGGLTSFVILSLFTGTVGYVNALSAQYYGAEKEEYCVRTVPQGIFLSLIFYPIALSLIPLVGRYFQISGHSAQQIQLEYAYFRILILGGIFALIRTVLGNFFLGIGKSRIVMYANLAGMVINIPVNYILIFGKWGMPALGIEGAAIGTLAGSLLITVILTAAFLNHKMYKGYKSQEIWKIHPHILGKLFRYGAPAGIELFLNVFAFNMFVQLFHSYSEDVAAAVTIAFNYDMVAFIPMLGLGFATTSFVGQQMGANSSEAAEKVVKLSMKIGLFYALTMTCVFVFGADLLVNAFTGGLNESDTAVIPLAKTMLRMASIYTLADVIQLVYAGALRGAGDTKWVMYISVGLHWLMAAGSVIMIKILVLEPLTIWAGFITFVMLLGFGMYLRYNRGTWKQIRLIADSPVNNA